MIPVSRRRIHPCRSKEETIFSTSKFGSLNLILIIKSHFMRKHFLLFLFIKIYYRFISILIGVSYLRFWLVFIITTWWAIIIFTWSWWIATPRVFILCYNLASPFLSTIRLRSWRFIQFCFTILPTLISWALLAHIPRCLTNLFEVGLILNRKAFHLPFRFRFLFVYFF